MVSCWPERAGLAPFSLLSWVKPIEKKGPTVWDAVASRLNSILHGRSRAATENNVEAKPQRLIRERGFPVEERNQPVASLLICSGVEDRIERKQRVAGEIHLR